MCLHMSYPKAFFIAIMLMNTCAAMSQESKDIHLLGIKASVASDESEEVFCKKAGPSKHLSFHIGFVKDDPFRIRILISPTTVNGMNVLKLSVVSYLDSARSSRVSLFSTKTPSVAIVDSYGNIYVSQDIESIENWVFAIYLYKKEGYMIWNTERAGENKKFISSTSNNVVFRRFSLESIK